MAMVLEKVEQRQYTYQVRQASEIKRGEIYFADLSPVVGSEQGGNRPVLVIQNDIGNKFSTTIIVATITTKERARNQPTFVHVTSEESGLLEDSTIHLEQIRTIDKTRLISVSQKIGTLSIEKMKEINRAMKISLGLAD